MWRPSCIEFERLSNGSNLDDSGVAQGLDDVVAVRMIDATL